MKYTQRCLECGHEYSNDCTRAYQRIIKECPTRMIWCIACKQTTAHEYEVSHVS